MSLHHVGHGAGRVVRAVDRLLDAAFGGDVRLDFVAGDELDVVDGEDVRRIAHRDHQPAAGARDRERHELGGDVARNQTNERGIGFVVAQIDRRHAVVPRQEVEQPFLGDRADLDEIARQRAARALLLLGGLDQRSSRR